MTDGTIYITDMPTDTAAMIWHALHQTRHARTGEVDPLNDQEKKLYEELTAELTARAADAKAQRAKEGTQ
jgi:hypothetical protein